MRVARAAGAASAVFDEDEWDSQYGEGLEPQQDGGPGGGESYTLRRFLEDSVSPEDLVREF